MDRRQFFFRGINKIAETAVEQVDSAIDIPVSWIRPPFAVPEPEFLLMCTRCDACIDACPEKVIFSLNASHYLPARGTPSMDLQSKACLLCDDWPCVNACESGALAMPESANQLPEFGVELKVNNQHCLPYSGPDCGACSASCPVAGALVWNDNKPEIVTKNCIGCAKCRESCITSPKSIDITLQTLR